MKVCFRFVKGVFGFLIEIVMVIVLNIKSMEYRREFLVIGYKEYLCVCSIDYLKVFFVFLYYFLGNVFILKEFKIVWTKVFR